MYKECAATNLLFSHIELFLATPSSWYCLPWLPLYQAFSAGLDSMHFAELLDLGCLLEVTVRHCFGVVGCLQRLSRDQLFFFDLKLAVNSDVGLRNFLITLSTGSTQHNM